MHYLSQKMLIIFVLRLLLKRLEGCQQFFALTPLGQIAFDNRVKAR